MKSIRTRVKLEPDTYDFYYFSLKFLESIIIHKIMLVTIFIFILFHLTQYMNVYVPQRVRPLPVESGS